MKFKLRNGGPNTGPMLELEADKDDELAYVDAERVYRGDLDSFLPFSYRRGGKSYLFSYFPGAFIPVENVLKAPLDPVCFRNMLGSLLHMMQLCESYNLSRLRVVYDPEHTFLDPTSGMLKFVYVPLRMYVSQTGEADLLARICSATMADPADQQFAISVWDFVHRTTILTSVALEDFLKEWGLQAPRSTRNPSQRAHFAMGSDNRNDHGFDFVKSQREEDMRRRFDAQMGSPRDNRSSIAPDSPPHAHFTLVRTSTGEAFPLGSGLFVLGRSKDCAISIPDAQGISRKHASIEVSAQEAVLQDLGSTNGVFVNGERLAPKSKVRLTPGTQFSLAEEQFQLRCEPPSSQL